MARISSYPYDNNVTDGDAWIGTDASNRSTKQFTAEALAKYLNIKGKISISAQMVYKFNQDAADTGEFTGNGSLIQAKYYDFAAFSLAGDKTFIFDQGVPAATWNITHNLGKFPSVSVVDTANTAGFGAVSYTNDNQLTITFSGAFAGKAYLN
jgi:hypothetical protein